jgi:pyruvate kinase
MTPATMIEGRTGRGRSARPQRPMRQERNTKIVCTVGPACATPEKLRALIAAGANVLRLNFSHSDHAWHSRALETIREAAREAGRSVGIMQDLCGPKIRLTRVQDGPLHVAVGDVVRITTEHHAATAQRGSAAIGYDLATNYGALLSDVEIGDSILVDDGRIEMLVEDKPAGLLVTRVLRDGVISVGKGLNLPGIALSTESMTSKDWEDLKWGIEHAVDFVALSFVRRASDLQAVRDRLDEAGSHARLIAKIERPEAISHLDAILSLADGLMVARGDLGLETELAEVPLLQKELIDRCRRASKPVITATQMLESMVLQPTPTRAEVSDVANAIYDGTDAIMLSAETATGAYPEEAVAVLDRVARVTEAGMHDRWELQRRGLVGASLAGAIVEGATVAALTLKARRVVVYSQSGLTARLMARSRLPMPVVAVTNVLTTFRQLSLTYGVCPVYLPHVVNLPQLLSEMDHLVLEQQWGEVGETLVVVSALDGRDGNIDTLHIHRVQA